jgi:hypothetical protein
MSAAKYDFNIQQGSSFRLSLVCKNQDKEIIDLTNWCARLIMKTNNNQTIIFDSTNTDYSSYKFTIDGPNGKITLLIPSETTNNWNFKLGKYDLEIRSPDDLYSGGGKYSNRLLYGNINIVKRFSSVSDPINCSV